MPRDALPAGTPSSCANPDAIRPWQHVLEPLSGYLELGARLLETGQRFAGAWNFGPTDAAEDREVRWVVERFLAAWGHGTWTTQGDAEPQPHEAHRLSLDSTKAHEQLGWAPVWDAEIALRRTADWYREYYRAPARARALVKMGAHVTGYALDRHAAEPVRALDSAADGHVVADVRDAAVSPPRSMRQPSIIFHSPRGDRRRGYVQPVETFETNVMGTVNVLEAGAGLPVGARGRDDHQRQVLPEPGRTRPSGRRMPWAGGIRTAPARGARSW